MKTSTLKSITLSIFTLFIAATLLVSCSKSNSNPTPPASTSRTVKFTVSIGGVLQASPFNDVSMIFSGVTEKGNKTVWSLNGVAQNNTPVVTLTNADFGVNTRTYIIQSVVPLDDIIASIQCENNSNNSYTVSFMAEVNGKVVQNDQNIVVTQGHHYLPGGGNLKF